MDKDTIIEIANKANHYFDKQFQNGDLSYELRALENTIEEHTYCFSIGWCLKSEYYYRWKNHTHFAGGGPLMISKISDDIYMAGSGPRDWVREFELKIRGLEEYWCLEITYEKTKISALKSHLNLSTPELLSKVNHESKILLEGEDYELRSLQKYLNESNVENMLELRERKKGSTKI